MTTKQGANGKGPQDVENPYRVLSAVDSLSGQSQNTAGRWDRSLQVVALILAILFLLVNLAAVYEVWRSYSAPSPWNSVRWRSGFFRAIFVTGLGLLSSVSAAYLLPKGKWSGRVLWCASIVLLFVLFRI